MTNKHYYLEQLEGKKVVRRVPTTLQTADQDREKMEHTKGVRQKVVLVVSSTKEKIIN